MNQDRRCERTFAIRDMRVEAKGDLTGLPIFDIFQIFAVYGCHEETEGARAHKEMMKHDLTVGCARARQVSALFLLALDPNVP
jgi:hypothetical protein